MEYSDETSGGQGPDDNAKLIEMGEIGLSSPTNASFNHCADDSEETRVEKCTENQNSSKCLADDNVNDQIDASTGNLNSTEAPAPSAKQTLAEFTEFNYELQQAYRILRDLMSEGNKGVNSPFMDSVETVEDDVDDYYEVITKPMWLKKVRHKFLKRDYNNITEVVSDVRLILENCYRYNGPDSPLTKKALRLEQILEQKLALLPRELRDKTTLEITSGRPVNDDIIATRRRSTRQSLDYTSILLNLVRHEKAERNKELKKKLTEGRKAEKEEKEKEVLTWEDKLLEEPLKTQMKAMWELPMIGHFFYLCQNVLNMPEVSQFELERILVMPRASSLLPKIMTSLLSNPTQRASLDRNPPMPYKVWQSRLTNRIQSWYKILHARENRGDLVFQQLGIEVSFFKILGTQNPLNEKRFHELSFHQRIWCIKGLCDYILYNHRTIQDALNDQLMDDMREYVLGNDSVGNMYLHFPQFCGQDLRIYKQRKCTKPPSPGCWGAPYTKKRKLAKAEKISLSPAKKQKTESPKPPVKKVQPVKKEPLSEPPLALLYARRSPRFSKLQEKTEEEPCDELEDTDVSEDLSTEDEESTEESESDSEADDDEDLEPNIDKFELVVDSVESLRTFMEKFKCAYENMRNRKERQPYSRCEAELYRRLKNLLAELEPWESKLQKSAQRIRNRLRREWDGFVEDEEDIEDIWGSDGESEGGRSSSRLSTSDNSNAELGNSGNRVAFKPEKPATRASSAQKVEPVKPDEISTEELLNQDDDSCEYLTRGRLQQIRIMRSMPKKNIKSDREIRVNGSRPGQQNLLLAHSRHNTTSQAKELYAWETLRQILVPASNSKCIDLQGSGNAHQLTDDNNSPKQVLPNNINKVDVPVSTTSPEKQILIHAKLDMLGAMQAAMAKNPCAASFQPKQPQSNNSKIFLKTGQAIKGNHIMLGKQTKASCRSRMAQMLSCPTIPKYKVSSPSKVPTKQQLSELSSVAENTTNLKRLLERVNKVTPATVISSTASSPTGGDPSTQPKAQVMLFPMVDAEGKSVVYRVTSNKTLSSIPGVDIKKIALALATSTTSALPPGFVVEKISVEGDLLHGQASSISHDVLADIAFRQTNVTAKSSPVTKSAVYSLKPVTANPAVMAANKQITAANKQITAVKKQITAQPHNAVLKGNAANEMPPLQAPINQMPASVVTSLPSNSLPPLLSRPPTETETTVPQQSVQQQMLLVPVQNQHGQTMYLQIPAQAPAVVNTGKPAATQIQKSPPIMQSQAIVRAPVSVAGRAMVPTQPPKPLNSQLGTHAVGSGNSSLACRPNKAAASATQRLIPALSSRRQNSAFLNTLLVSNPPSLAPLSKPKTPTAHAGSKLGGSMVTPGLSSVTCNSTSTVTSPAKTSIVLQSAQQAANTFSGTFSLGSTANNKPTVVTSVLPTPLTNGFTPAKIAKVHPNITAQSICTPQTVVVAPPTFTHTTSHVATSNPNANLGIMTAPVGQAANLNNNDKLNVMPHMEYSPDALSASVASLVSKNPALAATVQKYMQSGHRVMIAQQGNQLVLQAYPPQVNVTVPQATVNHLPMATKSPTHVNTPQVTLPQKQVQVALSPSNAILPKTPTKFSAVPNWSVPSTTPVRIQNNVITKVTSPNVTQNMLRPPAVIQSSAPCSLSLQVAAPGTINQTAAPAVMQNVVCQSVVSSPNTSAMFANSSVITSSMGSTGQISKTTNATQHKLVMIRDTTSDKQTLGVLLDNGQVMPLNASISFTNSTVS